MRDLYFTLPLLVFFFAGLLILLVLRGKTRSPLHRMFSFMLLGMALWGLTIFGMRVSASPDSAIAWEKGALIAIMSVSLFFYHFTRLFTQRTGKRFLLPLVYLASLANAGLVASGLVVPEMQTEWYGYAPRFGPLFITYLSLVYTVTFLGIWNLIKYYRNSPSQAARNRTLYVLLGTACSLLGGVSDTLPPLMVIYPIGIGGNLFFAFFTTIAILKHNLLDAQTMIKKGFVYSVVSGAILGVYIAVLFSVNLLFQNSASALSWSGNLAAVLTVAILLKPILDRVQSVADSWFWRRRYEYLPALEGFSHETKDITDLRHLSTVLKQFVTTSLGAEATHLLVPSPNSSQFISLPDGDFGGSRSFRLRAKSPILAWLRSHDDILRREDLRIFPMFLSLSAHDQSQLEHFRVQLLIPLKHREKLSGILILARKRSEEPYSEEDLGLLRAVAHQTALGLANARLFASVVSQRTRLQHLLERVIRAQEDERKRLSMELHDAPVQWLTSAVYRLEACLEFFRRAQYQKAWEELEDVQGVLDKTLAELRHATAALHPPELEKVGLVKALIRHVNGFERDTGILCQVEESETIPRLSPPEELAVYRVIQESLSNIRKHSQATEVKIKLGQQDGALRAVVWDNGIGFEIEDSHRAEDGHLGLVGMEERARMLGGTLTINSIPEVGTQITLLIPLSETPRPVSQPIESDLGSEPDHRGVKVAI